MDDIGMSAQHGAGRLIMPVGWDCCWVGIDGTCVGDGTSEISGNPRSMAAKSGLCWLYCTSAVLMPPTTGSSLICSPLSWSLCTSSLVFDARRFSFFRSVNGSKTRSRMS